MTLPELEPFDAKRAVGATGLLEPFNACGLLAAADVHVAQRLTTLAGERDEAVALAIALAVRAPRHGHVFVDLRRIADTADVDAEDEEIDLSVLPWPEPEGWIARLAASPLVAVGEGPPPPGHAAHPGAAEAAPPANRPLRLDGSALYLDRYWREERQVAADLLAFGPARVDERVLEAGLGRLFAGGLDDSQREAAEAAVRRRFAVVAGGPGTGKTTTVARILALLFEQSPQSPPLVALAAPTGKAAQRLQEAVRETAEQDAFAEAREFMLGLSASTLHKLLGARVGSNYRRHHRFNRLPHEVVIVDETSMVSLSMMARLVEAVRPEARLILIGDPNQLSSIEAGAVLSDIVEAGREGVVELDHVFRFGAGIGALASAILRDDDGGDAAVEVLRAQPEGVRWIEADIGQPEALAALDAVREDALQSARRVIRAARAGDAAGAISALGAFRILCAHRHGPYGVEPWMLRIEQWLESELDRGRWYVGRPLLVTKNDYALNLRNGDTGVIVATPTGGVEAAFETRTVAPTRLSAVETVHAMTVHKSQGSQFGTAVVLLPPPSSPLLTRELLYTAVTRAQQSLVLVGTETSVRAAVTNPIARASGLARLLKPTVP